MDLARPVRGLPSGPEDGTVDLLQVVAAALIAAGSALVLRVVWMADAEPESPRPEPVTLTPAEDAGEWRKAA